jgi:hypothetical protein
VSGVKAGAASGGGRVLGRRRVRGIEVSAGRIDSSLSTAMPRDACLLDDSDRIYLGGWHPCGKFSNQSLPKIFPRK